MAREVGEEFYLDWERDKLQIFEPIKGYTVIDCMRAGIRIGCEFPPVNVSEVEDNFYRLVYGGRLDDVYDGGNHRAISHYQERAPLKCIIPDSFGPDPGNYVDVGMFSLGRGLSIDKLRDSLSKLPKDIAKRFCLEYGSDLNEFLPQ